VLSPTASIVVPVRPTAAARCLPHAVAPCVVPCNWPCNGQSTVLDGCLKPEHMLPLGDRLFASRRSTGRLSLLPPFFKHKEEIRCCAKNEEEGWTES
jgi:hypothetical protein